MILIKQTILNFFRFKRYKVKVEIIRCGYDYLDIIVTVNNKIPRSAFSFRLPDDEYGRMTIKNYNEKEK